MKKQYYLLCFLLFLSTFLSQEAKAQILWQDDLDAFISDTLLEPQSPDWIGWGNVLTSTYTSTDFAFNGSNSIKIWNANLPGNVLALSDVIRKFGDSTAGRYLLKFKVYVPSVGVAAGTYWNILHSVNANNVGTEWAMQIFLRPKGAISTIQIGGVEYPIPARFDDWVEVAHVFDLDRDLHLFFYDGKFIVQQPFSYQAFATSGLNQLSAIDLFAECNSPGCVQLGYFDDFLFKRLPDPQNDAGITDITIPAYCLGDSTPVILRVKNWGFNNIDTLTLNWSINGVLQSPFVYSTIISPASEFDIPIGNHLFSGQAPYQIKAWPSDVNMQQDTVYYNDTSRTVVGGPALEGNYTIDPSQPASSTNYTSFSTLMEELSLSGICSSVYINVAPGIYNETIKLESVDGTNDSTIISIDGGDSSLVILENNLAGQNALVSLNAVSYLTIKNMTFKSNFAGASEHFGIHFSGASSNDSIVDCRILLNPNNTAGGNVIAASANLASSFAEGINASDITVINCELNWGYYGVHFEGNGQGNYENKRNSFINNKMQNQFFYGFFMDDQDSLRIEGNTITRLRNTITDGLFIQDPMNFKIIANFINAKRYGIYISNANSMAFSTISAELINNMVTTSGSYSLFLLEPIDIFIWHNSFYTSSNLEAVFISGTLSDSLDFRNNILFSENAAALRTTIADSLLFLKLDNNVYHTNGTNLLNHNGVNHTSLANYQTAQSNFDIRSLQGDPGFTSSTDLHIVGTFVNNTGDNFLPVNVDIDGDPRPFPFSTDVDPGADEFDPPLCPPPSNFYTSNPSLDSVNIVVNGNSLEYQWELIREGALRGSGSFGVIFGDSVRVGGLNANTSYEVYVREICGRGDTSVWIGPIFFNSAFGIPFIEDFETFPSRVLGNPWPRGWTSSSTINPKWESLTSTGFNWSSFATGPLVDHTLSPIAGGTYVFLETSGGVQGSFSEFTSPPIFVDASYDSLDFSFWYHMHGASMGSLEVMVDTNGVRNTVATIVGQQQVNQGDAWIQRSLILRGYAGKNVRLVFKGIRGSSFTGDLAIDDIELKSFDVLDASLSELTSPKNGVNQCYTANETVIVSLKNSGSIPIDFSIDTAMLFLDISGTIVSSSSILVADNSLNGGLPLAPNEEINIDFGTINTSLFGAYEFDFSLAMNSDVNSSNDSLSQIVLIAPTSGGQVLGPDSSCSGDTIVLSAANYQGELQWQSWNGTAWVNLFNDTLSTISVAPTTISEYRVLACGTEESDTLTIVPVVIPQANLVSNTDSAIGPCGAVLTARGVVSNPQVGINYRWYTDSIVGSEVVDTGYISISALGDTVKFSGQINYIDTTLWVESSINGIACANSRQKVSLFLQCTSGIDDVFQSNTPEIAIYPNPSSGQFTLELKTEESTPFNLSLRSITGKIVYSSTIQVNRDYREELNFTGLAKGLYFLEFQNGGFIQTKKLIIH